jgi:hypothetical protein
MTTPLPAVKHKRGWLATTGHKPISILLLLTLPALLVLAYCAIKQASGAYWLGENLDPSYAYLENSLNMANLRRPYGMEPHPGVPVELLGAATVRGLNLTAREPAIANDVLRNPETYLGIINGVFVSIAALCLLIAGYVTARVTGSLISGLLLQAAPFLSVTTLQGLFGVRPEAVFIAISILFAMVIVCILKFDVEKYALRYCIAFGVLAGLGMATKLNFLSLLIIPIFLLPSWKWRAFYAGATAVSFGTVILPIMTPSHLQRMVGFAYNASTHTGRYGSGSAGIVDNRYFSNLGSLITTDWLFFVVVAVSALALLLKAVQWDKRRQRILLVLVIVQIAHLLLVAKHPSSHYLIPAMGLAGINLIILFDALRRKETTTTFPGRAVLMAVICLVLVVVQGLAVKNLLGRLRAQEVKQRATFDKVQNEFKDALVVDYYTVSSPAYALQYGAEYSGNLYSSVLGKLYPQSYFYNPWTFRFFSFAGPVDIHQVTAPRQWFIMRGYSLRDSDFRIFLSPNAFPRDITLEPIYGEREDVPGVYEGEAVYKATFKAPG